MKLLNKIKQLFTKKPTKRYRFLVRTSTIIHASSTFPKGSPCIVTEHSTLLFRKAKKGFVYLEVRNPYFSIENEADDYDVIVMKEKEFKTISKIIRK